MPRVLFIENPLPVSIPLGEDYRAGQEYDLTDDQAQRWYRRGVAVPAPAPAKAPESASEQRPKLSASTLASAPPSPTPGPAPVNVQPPRAVPPTPTKA